MNPNYIHPGQQHGRWETDVRDPADTSAENPVQYRRGKAKASYRIAQIPAGWAWRTDVDGPDYYSGTPWCGPEDTRDAAINAAIDRLVRDLEWKPDDHRLLIEAVRPTQGGLW